MASELRSITRLCFSTFLITGIYGCGRLWTSSSPTEKPKPEKNSAVSASKTATSKTTKGTPAQKKNTHQTSNTTAARQQAPAFGKEFTNDSQEKPAINSELQTAKDNSKDKKIEIIWRVSGEAVEKYHINYGLTASTMDKHVEVPVREIKKMDHPKLGPVFVYQLDYPKDASPEGQVIFVSLRAENKSGISPPSPPIEVIPGKSLN